MDAYLLKDNLKIFVLFGISSLLLGSAYFFMMAIIQNNDDILLQVSQALETTSECIVFPGRRGTYEV